MPRSARGVDRAVAQEAAAQARRQGHDLGRGDPGLGVVGQRAAQARQVRPAVRRLLRPPEGGGRRQVEAQPRLRPRLAHQAGDPGGQRPLARVDAVEAVEVQRPVAQVDQRALDLRPRPRPQRPRLGRAAGGGAHVRRRGQVVLQELAEQRHDQRQARGGAARVALVLRHRRGEGRQPRVGVGVVAGVLGPAEQVAEGDAGRRPRSAQRAPGVLGGGHAAVGPVVGPRLDRRAGPIAGPARKRPRICAASAAHGIDHVFTLPRPPAPAPPRAGRGRAGPFAVRSL